MKRIYPQLRFAVETRKLFFDLQDKKRYPSIAKRIEYFRNQRTKKGLRASNKVMANALSYAIIYAFKKVSPKAKTENLTKHERKIGQSLIPPSSRTRLIFQEREAKEVFFKAMESYVPQWTSVERLKRSDNQLLKELNKFKNPEIADIGCASGKTTEELARKIKSGKITGYDLIVKYTPKKGRAQYKEHNILEKPLGKKYDIVRLANVFFYFTKEGKNNALKNISESLKENGLLQIVYQDRPELYKKTQGKLKRIKKL